MLLWHFRLDPCEDLPFVPPLWIFEPAWDRELAFVSPWWRNIKQLSQSHQSLTVAHYNTHIQDYFTLLTAIILLYIIIHHIKYKVIENGNSSSIQILGHN